MSSIASSAVPTRPERRRQARAARKNPLHVRRIHDPKAALKCRPGLKVKTLVLDFETYYSKDYTLRKMSTSEYVRHEEFKIHCVGVKLAGAKTRLFYDMAKFSAWLDKTQGEYEIELVGHNLYFDGLILHHHFGFVPAFYRCTMSMTKGLLRNTCAAGLDIVAKVLGFAGKVQGQNLTNTYGKCELTRDELRDLGSYCADDCEDTYNIYQTMLEFMPPDEMEIIDTTVRCFCDPILEVNGELLQEAIAEVEAKRASLRDMAETLIQRLAPGLIGPKRKFETVLRSKVDFPALLEALGVDVPYKQNEKLDWVPALSKKDPEFLELCEDENPLVRMLCEARLQFTSNQTVTRATRLLDATNDGDLLPVMYGYCGAHTMRWTAGNKMNLQNLQRGSKLRRAIEAPLGFHIMTGDSSQIEARIVAFIAGQWDLVDAFAQGRDVYSEFASEYYGRKVTKQDEVERHIGKTAILGLGYGMGWAKFITTMATSFIPTVLESHESKRITSLYRSRYDRIPALWKYHDEILMAMASGGSGYIEYDCGLKLEYEPDKIWMPNGLALHYPNLQIEYNEDGKPYGYTYTQVKGRAVMRKKIYGGLLTENVVQCLARIVVADQLNVLSKAYRIVMTTHDEISMLVKASKAALTRATKAMVGAMSTPPWWAPDLPVGTEVKDEPYYCK